MAMTSAAVLYDRITDSGVFVKRSHVGVSAWQRECRLVDTRWETKLDGRVLLHVPRQGPRAQRQRFIKMVCAELGRIVTRHAWRLCHIVQHLLCEAHGGCELNLPLTLLDVPISARSFSLSHNLSSHPDSGHL